MENAQPFTLALARQVLFTSFALSQGSLELHELLFAYVAASRPTWQLDEGMVQALFHHQPALIRLAEKGLHAPFTEPAQVAREWMRQVEALRQMCQQPPPQSERYLLLARIAYGMIEQDVTYLCDRGGRPRGTSVSGHTHRYADPSLSHFCWYVLLLNTTGATVFDEMCAAIAGAWVPGSALFEAVMDETVRGWLHQLLKIHHATHPTAPLHLALALPHHKNDPTPINRCGVPFQQNTVFQSLFDSEEGNDHLIPPIERKGVLS